MIKIETVQEFENLLHNGKPFFLMKHSNTCPISGAAYDEYALFTEKNPDFPCYYLVVQEARPLSNYIAETFNIKHESPQALLFNAIQQVEWNASHWKITNQSLSEAIQVK